MISIIIIRDININQHQINEYVICFIYMTKINDQKKKIRVIFRRELHMINVLKIIVFINNDIMNVKNISINSAKRIVKIKSCKIIVLIEVVMALRM